MNRKQKFILREGKILKLRAELYQNCVKIGRRVYYYPDLEQRVCSNFAVLELSNNQLLPPIFRGRYQFDLSQRINELKQICEELKKFKLAVATANYSVEDIRPKLQKLLPHGFELQTQSHATKLVEISKEFDLVVDGQKLRGRIDSETNIAIFRSIPKSAKISDKTLINTAAGMAEKAVYEVNVKVEGKTDTIRCIQGEIPADFFLSPDDGKKFGLHQKMYKEVAV